MVHAAKLSHAAQKALARQLVAVAMSAVVRIVNVAANAANKKLTPNGKPLGVFLCFN